MIPLHPLPPSHHHCPHCAIPLEVRGWHIPGMRCLSDLHCPRCERAYYGDLPAGHGLTYPMLLDRQTGVVHDSYGVAWFAQWLRDAYAQRVATTPALEIERCKPLHKPILLNCLDLLYGHALLKLLNAQWYLDHQPDHDLVVLIPRFLRWMVPEGVAAIWTLDLPLRQGTLWSEGLAARIKEELAGCAEVWLSVAFSHPHPEDYAIERFTCVAPFDLKRWEQATTRPCVTFIWREDRLWAPELPSLLQQVRRWRARFVTPTPATQPSEVVSLPLRRTLTSQMRQRLRGTWLRYQRQQQQQRVINLASQLRQTWPQLDFAVAGVGMPGGLPRWITELRQRTVDAQLERVWCQRYAQSHVVIGIHGSNMLLPSAHAGATIDLMPADRWGNVLQDILFRPQDQRASLYRYRCLPEQTSVLEVVRVIHGIMRYRQAFLVSMQREYCTHSGTHKTEAWLHARQQIRG